MATFNKHNAFVEDVMEKVHNLSSDQLVVYLTSVAPVATNSVLLDLTQISYTNLSSRNLTTSSSGQTAGVYKLVLADLVLTASGDVEAFRYVGLYNDTPISPADPLIGWWDYGSTVTLHNGDTFTIDFDPTNGVLQLT